MKDDYEINEFHLNLLEDCVTFIENHINQYRRLCDIHREPYHCVEEKKQAAADVLFQYSNFVMACIGNQVRPCDLRLHLMKEVSGLPTSLKREPRPASSPDVMGESSSSGTSRLDKADSFRGP